jgi:hypothetical protein
MPHVQNGVREKVADLTRRVSAFERRLSKLAKVLGVAVLISLLPAVVSAQHLHNGASGLKMGVPDLCSAPGITNVKSGRWSDPSTWSTGTVPVTGSAVRIAASSEVIYDVDRLDRLHCVGVAGRLVWDSAVATRLVVGTTYVYDGGDVEVGTAAKPIAFERPARITIGDVPLDLARDPEQFGTGWLVFGRAYFHGTPSTRTDARSIIFSSENPNGVRGHCLVSQRADIDVRYVAAFDTGRTDANRPLDSTTFDANGNVTHTGTNQIGKYDCSVWHAHHLMGPPPGSGRQYQAMFVGNLSWRSSKWVGVAHNSHHILYQDNMAFDLVGSCWVEEDGSETGNKFINNLCENVRPAAWWTALNPSGSGYDPEGVSGSGFWMRGINAELRGNVVRKARLGFGFWTGCLEVVSPHPCSVRQTVTIPKFPGADTKDPAQIETCRGADGSPSPCMVLHRKGSVVDGNTVFDSEVGVEHWWTLRQGWGSPPITAIAFSNVKVPIAQFYSDVEYDGVTATIANGAGSSFASIFNDGHPIGFYALLGTGHSTIAHATATGYDLVWQRTGQLHQAPDWRITDSTFTSKFGVKVELGGETVVGYPNSVFALTNVRFLALAGQPLRSITTGVKGDVLPAQTITIDVKGYQGNAADNFSIKLPAPSTCTGTRPEILGFLCGSTQPEPTPPLLLAVSQNVTQASPDGKPVAVAYAAPVASGGVPPLAATCTPISGSLFAVGVTSVNCQASDAAAQKVAASFTVTVTFTPPQPVDVCKVTPLVVTGIKWPSGQTGNKSGTWNSGNFTLVEAAFKWAPLRFEAKDTRGCVVSVAK